MNYLVIDKLYWLLIFGKHKNTAAITYNKLVLNSTKTLGNFLVIISLHTTSGIFLWVYIYIYIYVFFYHLSIINYTWLYVGGKKVDLPYSICSLSWEDRPFSTTMRNKFLSTVQYLWRVLIAPVVAVLRTSEKSHKGLLPLSQDGWIWRR